MTTVNIFFVCSAEDLHDDILEVKDFIRQLNDRYLERSLQFKITVCEDKNTAAAMEKQKEDDQKICDSQLFVIMLYKNANEYTIEKFNVAYEHFQSSNAPAILTFFRTDGTKPTAEVQNFMDLLAQKLGHYFKTYSDIDAMKHYLLMQILNMKLDSGIEFRDGQAYVAGEPILGLDHLPELTRNVNLQKIQEKIDVAEQECLDKKYKLYEEDNDENRRALDEAERMVKDFKNEKKQVEKIILTLTQQAVKDCVKGGITPRHRQAISFLEQGDSYAAYKIYDIDEICTDYEQVYSEMQTGQQMINLGQQMIREAKEKAAQYVEEILDKIGNLMTLQNVNFWDKHYEAEKLYDEAIKMEEEMELNRSATKEYMEELISWIDSRIEESHYFVEEDLIPWSEIDRGEQVAYQYLQYERGSGKPKDRSGETLCALLLQKGSPGSKRESEIILRDLLSNCTEPQEEASLCHHLANGLENIENDSREGKNQEEILRLRRRACKITQELAKENREDQEENLALYCRELMYSLKESRNDESKKESEKLKNEWLSLNLEMAKRNPIDFKFRGDPYFEMEHLMHSVLPFCSDSDILNEAEEYFRASLDIDREIINSKALTETFKVREYGKEFYYFAEFLNFYRNDLDSHQEAESLYDEVVKIEPIFIQDGWAPLGKDVAGLYEDLIKIFGSSSEAECLRETEILYRAALKIWQVLAIEISADYNEKVASTSNDLASFLEKSKDKVKMIEAEKLYRNALEIRRTLAKSGTECAKEKLAISCENLAAFLEKNVYDSNKEIKELCREAQEIRIRFKLEDEDVGK